MNFRARSIIAFEGPDGVGKTTLLNQVAVELLRQGVPVTVVDYRASETGRAAYDLARDHDGNEMTRRYLMAAAAEEALELVYSKWNESLILLDRLHPVSDWCYGSASAELAAHTDRWIGLTETQHWPLVDLLFVLRYRHRKPTHALERRDVDKFYANTNQLRLLSGAEGLDILTVNKPADEGVLVAEVIKVMIEETLIEVSE